ncbi:MAG: hypothetical protein J6M60_00540 [Clostridia bacterium]|nr:hypothetical protein [Clostridia bacterium]
MNDIQKQIAKILWNFQSLREEQIIKLLNCSEKDINYLIAKKIITKDKNKILRYNGKEVNNRNVVAFDVVMEYLDRNPKIVKGKHPVNVIMQTDTFSYDIIAIKEVEQDALFETIDEKCKSDRIIIIIETKKYMPKFINTNKPCYICTYSPLEIVDRVN